MYRQTETNITNQQPYGRFEGTIELPEQISLAGITTGKAFPWKWLIIGGLVVGIFIWVTKKKRRG